MSKFQPTFLAHNGDVWHHTAGGWHSLAPASPAKLLALYQADAANTADWFHKRAGRLVTELEAAMALAATQRQERAAA